MQRDRNGVLRMFYRPQEAGQGVPLDQAEGQPVEAIPEGAMESAPVQAEAAASTDFWESSETVAFQATYSVGNSNESSFGGNPLEEPVLWPGVDTPPREDGTAQPATEPSAEAGAARTGSGA